MDNGGDALYSLPPSSSPSLTHREAMSVHFGDPQSVQKSHALRRMAFTIDYLPTLWWRNIISCFVGLPGKRRLFAAFIKSLIFRGKHAAHEVSFIILSFIYICVPGIRFRIKAFLYQKGISFYCDTLDFLLR